MALRSELRSLRYRDGSERTELHVFLQPWVWYLTHLAYHHWHLRTHPLFDRLEQLERRYRHPSIPLTNRRDMRCDRLRRFGRISVTSYPWSPRL